MRVGILTSSRADFGIYQPLLKALGEDKFFKVKIIAFGTHVSYFHGHTIDEIKALGYNVDYTIESLIIGDSVEANATATSLTSLKFSSFWGDHHDEFDLVFCIGDRFEMFAAVLSGLPFQIKFAHIHGGEQTLGAIDNVYRHCISHASWIHFTATEIFSERVKQLVDHQDRVFTVGALSLDNLKNLIMPTYVEFKEKWNLRISRNYVLVTFHPETISYKSNGTYISELISTINELYEEYDFIITMPNVDSTGGLIRTSFEKCFKNHLCVNLIENFGAQSYYSAMKYSSFLLGNTSSGIIEAASLNKMVINIGDRQKGRLYGDNVLHTPILKSAILEAASRIKLLGKQTFLNPYGDGTTAGKIAKILKLVYAEM